MIELLTDIVKNAAARYPDNTAYTDGKIQLSYRELDIRSSQLASQLLKFNLKTGDRVGIYMPRCVESVLAVYGIMKGGGAFVPLDPMAPAARSEFLIKDCGIKLVVTINSQTKKLSKILDRDTSIQAIIGTDQDLGPLCFSWHSIYQSQPHNFQLPTIHPDDLAYIMYTSGSTGAPKGIMHTHKSGLNYAKLSAELYHLDHKDKVASHAPLHFDISTFSYFTAPLTGATTVIIPEAFTKLPASLSSLLESEKITVWYSVPLALIQMVTNGALEQRDLSSLRWVLFGGEVFPPKYLRELMKLWPQANFCNVYGPAEINQCTNYQLDSLPEADHQIPLGKIWFDAKYKIIDQNDQVVEIGAPGELVVETNSMMRGYWNNPDLTDFALFKTTDENGKQRVYYRTGDLVVENKQGLLTFQGRNDRQVKIRGYRVELDEVEAVLASHQCVEEAATFLIEENPQLLQIGAAVIEVPNSNVNVKDLLIYCRERLPAYAVPDRIELMAEFPRTSSGKIRRSELVKYIE